ncbi:MAG: DNA recombination protein RmuC [Candidatus Omnitrophica bacterium]|nr:DNA recombination protein RmuC [Candidatus Omnitrophota bacterium]MDE2009142.1 DNA recombination protein RmuC [Candidatus Omnitrophota bacterium]MDE2215059.1 DNA recombination protein RmuC [Candidatus Omnitrophota bacterium]
MPEIILGIAGLFILAGAAGVLVFFVRKQITQEMRLAQEQILQTARQQMELSQSQAASQLEMRKQAIEHTVAGLKEELARYQQMLRESQGDQSRKFGSLENELKNAHQATQRLTETTVRLNNILGNVKLRGQWGERMAEDIIQYAGLIENVNYLKQNVNAASTKPDYTFLLPQGHCINMDVKFPLDNYLQMVNAAEAAQREGFEKEFIRNVKDRIKEIQNRDYINPSENTLDFVLLFIPNEQVFGLIQEKMPDVMDFALRQKVVLCSPFTLYAMLSVVRQAHEHFRFEKDIKKIIDLIDGFTKDYELFKNRFEQLGELIGKVGGQYADISEKSFRKLDGKIQRIEDHKKGHLPAETPKDLIDAA